VTSTIPEIEPSLLRRRAGYAATTTALVLLMAVVGVDAVGGVHLLGVDSTTVRDRADGVELAVTYGRVSRPALATPFDIEVHQPGGFDGPVTLAVDQEYLRMWDENALYPQPSSETVDGPWLVWEFDPPGGDTLLVSYDARIEPAAQEGRSGAVAVRDEHGDNLVEVSFTTRIWP
jgi:hypothetical protein